MLEMTKEQYYAAGCPPVGAIRTAAEFAVAVERESALQAAKRQWRAEEAMHAADRAAGFGVAGSRAATAVAVSFDRCYCPGDCNCHFPHRVNYCGCRQHELA